MLRSTARRKQYPTPAETLPTHAVITRDTQPAPISWSKRISEMGPTSVRSRRLWRINSWPAANGIICSSCAPSRTIEPDGTCCAIASRMDMSLVSTVIGGICSTSPEMVWIDFAHHGKFGIAWRQRFQQFISDTQRPSGIGQHFLNTHARMHGGEERLAIIAEPQHTECGNDGSGPGCGRQALRAPPTVARAEAGRRDVTDAIAKAAAVMHPE